MRPYAREPSADQIALGVLKASAICVALAALTLVFRSSRAIGDRPLVEDAFYSLTIARNIAAGHGMTVEGTLTNGCQPLFTLLCVPLFRLFPDQIVTPLRALIVLHLSFYLGTAFVLGRIAHDAFGDAGSPNRLARWVTITLFLTATTGFLHQFNGLETGCLVFSYVLLWRYWQTHTLENLREVAVLGALLGVVTLVRIDAVFFVAIVSALAALEPSEASIPRRVARFCTASGMAFCVSSPWWAYNYFVFGSLLPSSGAASQEWLFSLERIQAALLALSLVGMPWLYAGAHFLSARTVLAVVVMVALACVRVPDAGVAQSPGGNCGARTARFGAAIGASVAVLVVWYMLSSRVPGFYPRYFMPLLPVVVLFTSRRLLSLAATRRAWLGAAGATAIPLVCSVALLHLQVGFSGNILYSEQVPLVREYVPADEWVAAEQTGTLGYFRSHVLNLDGKVNAEALGRRRDMPKYLEARGIHWFCDEYGSAMRYLGFDASAAGWNLVAARGDIELYAQSRAAAMSAVGARRTAMADVTGFADAAPVHPAGSTTDPARSSSGR